MARARKRAPQPKAEKPKSMHGICRTCGQGRFTLAFVNHELHRTCKECGEIINPETGELIRRGNGAN